MPDILSSILDTQAPSIPNIDTVPEVPKWTSPTIEIPKSLQDARSTFDQLPQKDIDVSDFSNIVNNGLAPKETKDELEHNQIISSLDPNIRVPQIRNPEFRAFKTSDAIRYKQNPRLWNSIGYNPELPSAITDAMYDHNETTWESVKNVFPKFWETATFQFKNYFAEYADTAKAIGTLDANVLHDQDRFRTYTQKLKDLEDLYPDYASDETTKWYQLYRGDFWEESGSSLGFTLGTIGAALLENAAITAVSGGFAELGELYNTPRKIFKTISDYYSLRRAYGLARAVVGAKSIVGKFEAGAHIWRLLNGALAETAYEGFNIKNDYVTKWKSDFLQKNGRDPNKAELERAERAGNKMANATILFETPFLLASNAAQFGNLIYGKSTSKIFGAFGKQLERLFGDAAKDSQLYRYGIDAAGKTIVEDLPKEKFFPKVAKHVKNAMWEGTEESYQALVTKSTADYYNDKEFKKDQASIFKSLGTGFDYLRSNDGMKEFSAGFATGAIFEHVGKPLHFLAKPKQIVDEKTGEISYKTNLFNTYLNLGMKSASATMERQKMEKVAKALNAVDLNNMLKEDGIFSLIKDKRTALHMANYLKNNDIFNVQNIKSLQLMRFLYAGLVNGKIDHQISKLSQFSEGSFDAVKDFFGLDENEFDTKEKKDLFMTNFRAFTNDLHGKAAEFEKIFSTEKTKYQSLINDVADQYEKARNEHNSMIDGIKVKYNFKEEDPIDEEKITKEELNSLRLSNANLLSKIYNFYGLNEGVKAAVFAQAGMKDDAKRADQIVRELNTEDTSGIKYGNELNQIFDKSYRDKRIADLKGRLNLATDESDKQLIKDQLTPFEKLSEELDNNFEKANNYKKHEVANLIQRYLHASQKEANPSLKLQPADFRGRQQEKLSQYIELQRRHQDNLDLLNQLSEDKNFNEYAHVQSAKLRDFFADSVELAEKYDDQERIEQKRKDEEYKAKKEAEKKAAETKNNPQAQTNTQTQETKKEETAPVEEKKTSTIQDSDKVKALIAAIKSGDQADIERAKEVVKDVNPELLYKFRNSGLIKQELYDPILKSLIGEKKFTEMYDDGVLKNKNARESLEKQQKAGEKLSEDQTKDEYEKNKQDIEKRRQEELLVPISLIKLPQYLAETIKKAVERLSVTQRYDIVKAAINGKTAQQIVSELNLIDENGRRDTEIVRQVRAYYGIPSLDAEDYKDWKISIDKINAKYDAELKALEQQNVSNVGVEEGSGGVEENMKQFNLAKEGSIKRIKNSNDPQTIFSEINKLQEGKKATKGAEFTSEEQTIIDNKLKELKDKGYTFKTKKGEILRSGENIRTDDNQTLLKPNEVTNLEKELLKKELDRREKLKQDLIKNGYTEDEAVLESGLNENETIDIVSKDLEVTVLKNGIQEKSGKVAIRFISVKDAEQSLKETTKTETTPTTSNQSEIEAKKADIERRRQEELNNPKEGLTKKDALIEAQKDLGNLDTKEKRDRNKDRIEALKQFINLLSNSNSIEEAHDKFKDSFTETTPVTNRIAELFNAIFGAKNNINAKYDAELKALEQKADIEKRRQEELKQNERYRVVKVEDYEATNEDGEKTYLQIRHYVNGRRVSYLNIEKNKYGNVNDNSPFEIAKEQSTEDYIKVAFDEGYFGKFEKTGERTAEEARLDVYDRKINLKYDKELSALNTKQDSLISDTGIKSDEATVNQAVKTSTEKANDFTNDIEAQKKALEEAKGKTPEQAEDEFDPNC